jgi:hypothetical protein
MTKILFSFLIAIAYFACTAGHGASVQFTLVYDVDPATYNLYATVLDDDNAGLAAYGVTVSNVLTIDHNSPRMPFGESAAGDGPAGFTLLRSPDGELNVFAGQDYITPTPHLIYGFGQTPSSFAAEGIVPISSSVEQPEWGVPVAVFPALGPGVLRIASGTYTPGVLPGLGPGGVFAEPFAFVFENASSRAVRDAQIRLLVTPAPEPSSVGMLVLASVTVVEWRRRHLASLKLAAA